MLRALREWAGVVAVLIAIAAVVIAIRTPASEISNLRMRVAALEAKPAETAKAQECARLREMATNIIYKDDYPGKVRARELLRELRC